MAATVTSAWAKPGAWALDSEEHEDELKQEPTNGGPPAAAMSDFPDLMTAASTKTRKKKGQTLSLGEFVNKPTANQSYQAAKGLTPEDMTMLPTGPRQRTAEELDGRTRLGGGFRSYGDRSNESSNSRWRSNGGEDKPSREPLGPSRADETDDWGAAKKPTIGDRRERGGRADDSDSWASSKSCYRPRERRLGGFESSGDAGGADNWGRKKEVEGPRFGAFDSLREKRVANDWGKMRGEELGAAGSRPKLNLQPRKLPVENVKPPTTTTKGSNPFGDARPREEVLKEKLDAIKLKDSDLDSTERSVDVDVDASSPSGEKSENGHTEEAEAEEDLIGGESRDQ